MMDNDLPNDFELVVIGTGMIESIVAAAASRIGKKVLHVDGNDYYGGVWASFNMEGVEKYIVNPQKIQKNLIDLKGYKEKGQHFLELGNQICGISNAEQHWHVPKNKPPSKVSEEIGDLKEVINKDSEKENVETVKEVSGDIKDSMGDDGDKKSSKEGSDTSEKDEDDLLWTQEKIMKSCRKFNLDLAPKLQFARGDFVELLISSNIARYSEYRSCSRVLTWLNGQLEIVPCSRSDVFSNTKVTVVEKRMLMKLLSTCMDSDENQLAEYENKKFVNYLKDKKLTPNLIHYVLYAISMSNEETLCLEAVKNTKRFLNSLGRFGKTPFLYSMYGSGELPQAFCRLCAVFGGTYCLNRSVHSLVVNSNNECIGVVCGNQKINADSFVIGMENMPEKIVSIWKTQKISRAIFITDRSIMPCEKENLTLLLFPPEDGKNAITLIELGPATGTCPPNLFVVHVYCNQISNPKDDLKHFVEKLLNTSDTQVHEGKEKNEENLVPNVLWSLYFTVTDTPDCDKKNELPKNIYPCNGPDLDLDYDNAVKKAKDVFMAIYPESEFLPRAPDPEEIILCDDEDPEKKKDTLLSEIPNDELKDENEDANNKTEENLQEKSAELMSDVKAN